MKPWGWEEKPHFTSLGNKFRLTQLINGRAYLNSQHPVLSSTPNLDQGPYEVNRKQVGLHSVDSILRIETFSALSIELFLKKKKLYLL